MDRFRILYLAVIGCLIIAMLLSLIRTIIGPSRADRIVGINLIGSLSTAVLAILSVMLKESWLLDVCLVYCLISFLTVVVLAKIHISETMSTTTDAEDKEEDRYA